MTTLQNELVNQVLKTLNEIQQTQKAMLKRVTRIESRLAQLMVFEGMQTDGRKIFRTEEEHFHAK